MSCPESHINSCSNYSSLFWYTSDNTECIPYVSALGVLRLGRLEKLWRGCYKAVVLEFGTFLPPRPFCPIAKSRHLRISSHTGYSSCAPSSKPLFLSFSLAGFYSLVRKFSFFFFKGGWVSIQLTLSVPLWTQNPQLLSPVQFHPELILPEKRCVIIKIQTLMYQSFFHFQQSLSLTTSHSFNFIPNIPLYPLITPN